VKQGSDATPGVLAIEPLLIAGEWVGIAGDALAVRNPATLEPVGLITDAGAAWIESAVKAAGVALPEWAATKESARRTLLTGIAERIRRNAPGLANTLSRESGKPSCECSDCIDAVADVFAAAATAVRTAGPATVVAAFAAARFPLLSLAAAVAPALAAGSTVVLKPSRTCPLAALKLARLARLADCPPGTLNVVTGGTATGHALIAHPGIGEVAYMGARSAADEIRVRASTASKRLRLITGPVDAIYVAADADLDAAVALTAALQLYNNGQRPGRAARVYVADTLLAGFADALHAHAAFLEVGDPGRPDTDLGPLCSALAARAVETQVGEALRAGARLKLGGRRFQPWGLTGHFFQPTLLIDPHPGPGVGNEILGPVMRIAPADGAREVARRAAGTGAETSLFVVSRDFDARVEEITRAGFAAEPRVRRGGADMPLNGLVAAATSGRRQALELVEARAPAAWAFPYRMRGVRA
jgi:acyl-CoA reductase-like NAD-dependent aldehyde dehydrogenase